MYLNYLEVALSTLRISHLFTNLYYRDFRLVERIYMRILLGDTEERNSYILYLKGRACNVLNGALFLNLQISRNAPTLLVGRFADLFVRTRTAAALERASNLLTPERRH